MTTISWWQAGVQSSRCCIWRRGANNNCHDSDHDTLCTSRWASSGMTWRHKAGSRMYKAIPLPAAASRNSCDFIVSAPPDSWPITFSSRLVPPFLQQSRSTRQLECFASTRFSDGSSLLRRLSSTVMEVSTGFGVVFADWTQFFLNRNGSSVNQNLVSQHLGLLTTFITIVSN